MNMKKDLLKITELTVFDIWEHCSILRFDLRNLENIVELEERFIKTFGDNSGENKD